MPQPADWTVTSDGSFGGLRKAGKEREGMAMHLKSTSVLGLAGLTFVLTAGVNMCNAAENDTYIDIKLYNGLQFKGILEKGTDEHIIIRTAYGERVFRKTDIISSRKTFTPEEKAAIDSLMSGKGNRGDMVVDRVREPEAARMEIVRVRDDAPAGRLVGRNFGEGLSVSVSPYERMSRQLDKRVTLEFSDTPLSECVDFLNSLTGLNMILSPKVREAKAVVTLRVSDMSAASVIKWITRLTETHAEVKDQALWITDKPSKEAENEEKNEILLLAASMGATVDLPPDGVDLTDADRTRIALQLWEKEQPKITHFPGPNLSIGTGTEPLTNPFAAPE
jgi:hypothetical protein